MKKFYLFPVVVCVLFFAGCSENASPAPVTDGGNGTIAMVQLANQVFETGVSNVVYMGTFVDSSGNTKAAQEVSVSGSFGTHILSEDMSGSYSFTSNDPADYPYGENVSVSAIIDGETYTGSIILAGDISVSADGNTVSWAHEGDNDIVQVVDPNTESYVFGPDLTSPYDLGATGVYNNGSGEYTILTTVSRVKPGAFSGMNPASSLSAVNQLPATITK